MSHFKRMETWIDFCYTLEVCLVIWMQYKSVCENLTNIFSITPYLHSFLRTFAHIWYDWDPTLVVFSLNCDFNWNLSKKLNSFCLFFVWLLSFKMSTLKSLMMMIGQCSKECWIIVWKLFRNVKVEHEWILYTHIIYVLLFMS